MVALTSAEWSHSLKTNRGPAMGRVFLCRRCLPRRRQSRVLRLRGTLPEARADSRDAVPPAFPCLKIRLIFTDTRFADTKKEEGLSVPSSGVEIF